jgi:hypothetical protein
LPTISEDATDNCEFSCLDTAGELILPEFGTKDETEPKEEDARTAARLVIADWYFMMG